MATLPPRLLRGSHPAAQVPHPDETLRGRGLRGQQERVSPLLRPRAMLPRPGPGAGRRKGEAQGQEASDPGVSQASAGGAQSGATTS